MTRAQDARSRLARVAPVVVAAAVLMAPGPKRAYENVNREIVVARYWDDATPANNLMPGSRMHDRTLKQRFEGRSFERFTAAELASAILAPDMGAINLLKEHAEFTLGGEPYQLDVDRFRRYVMGAKNNPDVTDVLVFDGGFILFAIATDDGWSDLLVPIDPTVVKELVGLVKKSR